MNTFFRTTALALCSTFVLVAASVPANAANAAEATPARVTFDGQIRNNSLALSPDEATAVVSFVPSAGDSSGRDLVALLAQRYPEIVASTDSVKQAATASGLSESEVQAGLSAAIQPGSLNMLLTVKAPTPEQADAAVDSLYKTTLKANEGDTNIKAVAVSAPSASSTPAGVPKKILYAAVVLLAAMVAVVVALIVDQFRSEGRG